MGDACASDNYARNMMLYCGRRATLKRRQPAERSSTGARWAERRQHLALLLELAHCRRHTPLIGPKPPEVTPAHVLGRAERDQVLGLSPLGVPCWLADVAVVAESCVFRVSGENATLPVLNVCLQLPFFPCRSKEWPSITCSVVRAWRHKSRSWLSGRLPAHQEHPWLEAVAD